MKRKSITSPLAGKVPRRSGPGQSVGKSSIGEDFSHGLRGVGTKRKRASTSSINKEMARLKVARTAAAKTATQTSPFPGFERPRPAEVLRFHTALAKVFKERRPLRKSQRVRRPILDTVVGTILSQNTTNINSHRAFTQLKSKFKSWEKVRLASQSSVASAIACGGLKNTKAQYIKHILQTVHQERGKTSLEYLRKLSKEEVHVELGRFPGIGKKTAAIINLFDVGHPDMAVDTHVFRYAMQLGWVPGEKERAVHNKVGRGSHWPNVTRDSCYAHLDAVFPDSVKYSMHLILTDTVGGLPVVCGARNELAFTGSALQVDGQPLTKFVK